MAASTSTSYFCGRPGGTMVTFQARRPPPDIGKTTSLASGAALSEPGANRIDTVGS